ncbi:MAG: class I SAM-dependent methyltransferase [Candidatus Omnitrophota bacterium]
MLLERFLSETRAAVVNKLIPGSHRKGRILDMGCGKYPYFLINTEFAEKYGIDRLVDEDAVRKEGEKIFISKSDIHGGCLSVFKDGYFDVVTMLAVFEHLEPRDLPRVMNEVGRVLKVNGLFIMTTPAPFGDKILRVLSALGFVDPKMIGEHKDTYDFNKISSILTKSGFEKEGMRAGRFELCLNIWVTASKKK